MRLLRLLSVSILALSMGLIGADAQNLRSNSGPAENPPASFKGKQYVDSRGCVYIRAGFSGNVTWVPRVTRSRKLVCGQTPSLKSASRTAKAAPRAAKAPAQNVVRKSVAPKIPKGAKVVRQTTTVIPAAPKPTTRVVRKSVAAPKPQTLVVRKQVAAPAAQPRVVRKSVAAPQPQAPVVRRQVKKGRATAQPKVIYRCGDASDFSSQFINDGARCGPQNARTRSVIREEVSPQSHNQAPQGQRVGPKGANRKIAEASLPIPKGHKAAWKDDRLNPLRGVGTTSGKAQMNLVWSNTVPRYLIDPATGKRATAKQMRVLGIF